jgi:hypothetical protein
MRSYTTTHATRTAHSTRRERMLSLLFRNNSSMSARYVRVRHTPPRPLSAQPAIKASLQFCGRRREKTKKTRRLCTTLTSYFSLFIEKDALRHRPGQPVEWRECSLNPKAGRYDELGQAIIPPLIETESTWMLCFSHLIPPMLFLKKEKNVNSLSLDRKRSVGNTAGCPGLPYRVQRATASLEVRPGGLRLVSPSRARHGKVRCITSHQAQPPLHNQWSRLAYLACVPFWNTGPYSLV